MRLHPRLKLAVVGIIIGALTFGALTLLVMSLTREYVVTACEQRNALTREINRRGTTLNALVGWDRAFARETRRARNDPTSTSYDPRFVEVIDELDKVKIVDPVTGKRYPPLLELSPRPVNATDCGAIPLVPVDNTELAER